jgi:EAL domain-containing protein (putative c-di-GMP-specific phosphodiesterase class I)
MGKTGSFMAPKGDTYKSFKAGSIIMRQGEKGESAYIIEKGRVEIMIERPGGKTQSVGTRGPGTMIGEMAIVDNAPRTATVKAVEDCDLLEITQEDFSRRLNSADPVLKMTAQVILTRYRDTLTRAEIRGDNYNWPPAEALELRHAEMTDAVGNIKIANDLKAALNNKELSLHYQPIVNLQKNGQVAGFEALMRWNHPTKGPISPGIFIPIAEESGLIVKASQWALRESCRALKRIEGTTGYDTGLYMSVNFSSTDFASEDFVGSVYNTISESDVKPSQVHIEITERLLMLQPDNAKDTLNMCRKAGMSIAIDDFGTGYSSLSYLHYFPIDTLKIDQSFVRDMHKNEPSKALVKSIIDLGKNLKMKIVAEGVETKEEATELKKLGCDLAQGYYFAKPMPEKEVTALLQDWPSKPF